MTNDQRRARAVSAYEQHNRARAIAMADADAKRSVAATNALRKAVEAANDRLARSIASTPFNQNYRGG